MTVLAAHNIGRRFGHETVLRGIDLTLERGERLAVMGPNGAGKTTLLRLLAGTLRPTWGHLQRPRTAFVGHDAPLYDDLTPREHVRWWTRLHGTADPGQAALADAGLAPSADTPVAGLSRGQRQRLALTLAWHAGADVLLLDEPFAALDAAGTEWLLHRLQGVTAVMALHDDDLATRLQCRRLRLGPEAGVPPTPVAGSR